MSEIQRYNEPTCKHRQAEIKFVEQLYEMFTVQPLFHEVMYEMIRPLMKCSASNVFHEDKRGRREAT